MHAPTTKTVGVDVGGGGRDHSVGRDNSVGIGVRFGSRIGVTLAFELGVRMVDLLDTDVAGRLPLSAPMWFGIVGNAGAAAATLLLHCLAEHKYLSECGKCVRGLQQRHGF